ncbi:MAG: ABC transporter ATP-binding protein [Gammaproteobacteria bacterium]|nr:ABC transporter ATP-binding protein [Gammaproteobacteria bacterium]
MKLVIAAVPRLLGRDGAFWFTVSVIASLVLALADYAVAIFIEALLKAIDLAPPGARVAGWLDDWNPGAVELLGLLALVGVLRGLSQFGQFQGNDLVHEVVNSRLRLLSAYDVLKNPAGKFVSAADTNLKVGEIFPKVGLFMFYSVTVVAMGIQCVVYLAAMLYTAWQEAIIGIVGAGVIGLIVLRINRSVRHAASGIPEEQKGLVTGIQRTADNWMLVRAFRTAGREHDALVRRSLNYYRQFVRAKTLGNVGAVVPIVMSVFLLVAIIFGSMEWFGTPGLSLVALVYLFARFSMTAGRVAKGFGLVSSMSAHFRLAAEYVARFDRDEIDKAATPLRGISALGSGTSSAGPPSLPRDRQISEEGPPEIVVDNAAFSHAATGPLILDGASLYANPGEQVGIVGSSGSGKSTLLGLMFGVFRPDKGSVRIAGWEPDAYFREYPERLGYVGADPFLVEGTIKDNLDYGSHVEHTSEEYREVLRSVHLLDDVDALQDGLDYRIEESGEGLSAGQKQRLSLARSLLRKPKVMILDEVASNLDSAMENEIALLLEQLKGRCTVVIVSHRSGILRFADRVYELTAARKLRQIETDLAHA